MANNSLGTLDSIYLQALNGVPGSDSVKILAENYLSEAGTLESKVDSLINWQIAKCSAAGFLTGLGGIITLPVSIPADVGVNLYVQARMAAAIAYMGGYDILHDKVKTMVYISLAGNAANEILKDVGVKVAMDFVEKQVSSGILKKIQTAIATRILGKSATHLVKLVPIFGGIVNAGFDGVATKTIGTTAKNLFIKNRPPVEVTRIVDEKDVPQWAKNKITRKNL